MKKFRKTLWDTALALVLALAVSLPFAFSVMAQTASTQWEVYQGDDSHTGQITASPLTASLGALGSANLSVVTNALTASTSLPTSGSGWSGVDSQVVMETVGSNTYAYVLYNGWSLGGVIAKIDCASATVVDYLTLVSGNTFQLSTPYLDTANRKIYAATNNGSVYAVDISTSPMTAASIFTGANGQINTPVVKYGNYLYFGSWVGNGTIGGATAPGDYYQLDLTGTIPTASISSGGARGFYWAGVYSDGTNVYFGGDDGQFYYSGMGANFGVTGGSFTLPSTAGDTRSTVSCDGTNLYFTSKGTGSNGYLWSVAVSDFYATSPSPTFNSVPLPAASTSTPAISGSGIIYVGYYNGFNSGGVNAYDPSSLSFLGSVYAGDPVQCSPIVYTDLDDYIYFTTNSSGGSGYCYSFDGANANSIWSATGSSSNRYALQGFAATNEYLVYGDDGDGLYIVHP